MIGPKVLLPTISERDVSKTHSPSLQFITQIRQAHRSRQETQSLLAKAKRALEVAIEEGEEKAFNLLTA